MDLDQLRTALALLQHRTVNRTAAAEGLAPSSVSDRIRRLEEELGAPLFVRDRTGMRPTAAGNAYLRDAARALGLLTEAQGRLTAPSLRVGAQASIADELLPAILDDLARREPDLQVELRPDPDRGRLLGAVADGENDAAVLLDAGAELGDLGFEPPREELEHADLREVEMVVVATADHALAGRPTSMAEIRVTGGLIGREERRAFWMATRRWLGADVDLTAAGGLAQVRDWVASGRGIALLPEFAVRSDLTSGRLVRLQVATPPLHLRLVWRHDRDTHLRTLLYGLSQA